MDRVVSYTFVMQNTYAKTNEISASRADETSPVIFIRRAAATAKINVQKLRGNISVLEGSGGNIAVLTGRDGKVLVAPVSRHRVRELRKRSIVSAQTPPSI